MVNSVKFLQRKTEAMTPLPCSPPHISPPARTARDVRELRHRLELTQAEFGALLGLSRATVCRMETSGKIGLLECLALQGLAHRVASERQAALNAIAASTITPAMIEAGVSVLGDFEDAVRLGPSGEELLVRKILEAALGAAANTPLDRTATPRPSGAVRPLKRWSIP